MEVLNVFVWFVFRVAGFIVTAALSVVVLSAIGLVLQAILPRISGIDGLDYVFKSMNVEYGRIAQGFGVSDLVGLAFALMATPILAILYLVIAGIDAVIEKVSGLFFGRNSHKRWPNKH